MYEDAYSTRWDTLEREEVFERAYALGVAAALDTTPAGELRRLKGAVDGRYDESLVDLAYREGKAKAEGLRDTIDTPREVWDDLIGTGTGTDADAIGPVDDPAAARSPKPTDLPPAVRRLPFLDHPRKHLDRLRLPEFLR